MTNIAKTITDTPFYMVDFAYEDLKKVHYRVAKSTKSKDAVLIYSGNEGTGKSTLATQHAYFLSKQLGRELSLDDFYFSPFQIYKAIQQENRPKNSIFIYDEGVTGLLGKTGMSKMGIKMHIMFSTCRSKKYPIFICIPRFWELPHWMAVDRSMAMYRTFEDESQGGMEGINKFVGYNRIGKMLFYVYKKSKNKEYEAKFKVTTTKPSTFSGWPFSKAWEDAPFTVEQYEKAKRTALSEEDAVGINSDKVIGQRDKLIGYLRLNYGMEPKEIAKICAISTRRVQDILVNVGS